MVRSMIGLPNMTNPNPKPEARETIFGVTTKETTISDVQGRLTDSGQEDLVKHPSS